MRQKLKKIEEQRAAFTGLFKKYGKKANFRGPSTETLLLVEIRDSNGEFVCNHLWFNLTKGFEQLGTLKEGDRIGFEARVKTYKKGYVNRRLGLNQTAVDYKLSHPTRITKLE
jgi:hypothetical protein